MVNVSADLETLYTDSCTVYETQMATGVGSHISKPTEVQTLVDIPCRISFQSSPQTTVINDVASVTQIIKLFINPSYSIKAGSKILVTRQGVQKAYRHSGLESTHLSHKEIILDVYETHP